MSMLLLALVLRSGGQLSYLQPSMTLRARSAQVIAVVQTGSRTGSNGPDTLPRRLARQRTTEVVVRCQTSGIGDCIRTSSAQNRLCHPDTAVKRLSVVSALWKVPNSPTVRSRHLMYLGQELAT